MKVCLKPTTKQRHLCDIMLKHAQPDHEQRIANKPLKTIKLFLNWDILQGFKTRYHENAN